MRLTVKVTPGAKHERVTRIDASQLRIAVTEPAREGRANAAVVRAVARFLDVPPSAVRVIHGMTRRTKVIDIGESR